MGTSTNARELAIIETVPSGSFDAVRRNMHKLGAAVGWKTMLGHRISNLIQQTKAYYLAEGDEQREVLKYLIAASLAEIVDLQAGREPRKLSPAQLLLEFMPDVR